MANESGIINSQENTQVIRETQEITESQPLDQSIVEEGVWGRLLSLRRNSKVINLVKESYTFGRGNVDFQFTEEIFDDKLLPALSKTHFIISRVKSETDYVIVIEDKSQNGTFINKELIKKNNKKFLRNNDEISLAQAKMKVFVFHDCFKNDASEYPPELNRKYIIMRRIGEGAYGEVRLAYEEGTLNRVAVKIMKKKELTDGGKNIRKWNDLNVINNEIELLRSVNHQCIVQLLDLVETPDKIFIIMELAEGGELFDRITANGRLSEPITKLYFYQLANAVAYLHNRKITHRDIKPENILLATEDEYTIVKLTDFGLSKLTPDVSFMTSYCGTQMYIAPELLVPESRIYNNKVDMWSLGVVLFVCLVGYIPFQGKNEVDKMQNIKRGNYNMKNPKWDDVSNHAKDLVKKLLVVDPQQRLSAEEVLQHKWFQDPVMLKRVNSLLDLFPTPSPVKRPLNTDEAEAVANAKTPRLMSGIEFQLGQNLTEKY